MSWHDLGPLLLIRHGETHWNRIGRLQGQQDSPLTLRGVRQMVAVGRHLAQQGLANPAATAWYVSPLGRTRQSAALIAEQTQFRFESLVFDSLLMERHQGAFDGLNRDEIAARNGPSEAERKRWDYAAPGGESLADVHGRALTFLTNLPPGKPTIVVSHGVFSRMMRAAYLGIDPDQVHDIESHRQDRFFRLFEGRVERIVCATDA